MMAQVAMALKKCPSTQPSTPSAVVAVQQLVAGVSPMTNATIKSSAKTWPELAIEGWMLGAEMSAGIWLRSLRMMTGGRLATREAERMVGEKITAAMTLVPAIMAGGIGQSAEEATDRAIAHYRKPVRANRRRLSR